MRSFLLTGIVVGALGLAGCPSREAEVAQPHAGQWPGAARPVAPDRPAAPPVATSGGTAPTGVASASAAKDPRCPEDLFGGSVDLSVVRDAVAVCIDGHLIDDPVAVAALSRAFGTQQGRGSIVKCRGGIPSIVMIDAKGEYVRLSFCAQLGVREARIGLITIMTADPAAAEAWLRERGVAIEK